MKNKIFLWALGFFIILPYLHGTVPESPLGEIANCTPSSQYDGIPKFGGSDSGRRSYESSMEDGISGGGHDCNSMGSRQTSSAPADNSNPPSLESNGGLYSRQNSSATDELVRAPSSMRLIPQGGGKPMGRAPLSPRNINNSRKFPSESPQIEIIGGKIWLLTPTRVLIDVKVYREILAAWEAANPNEQVALMFPPQKISVQTDPVTSTEEKDVQTDSASLPPFGFLRADASLTMNASFDTESHGLATLGASTSDPTNDNANWGPSACLPSPFLPLPIPEENKDTSRPPSLATVEQLESIEEGYPLESNRDSAIKNPHPPAAPSSNGGGSFRHPDAHSKTGATTPSVAETDLCYVASGNSTDSSPSPNSSALADTDLAQNNDVFRVSVPTRTMWIAPSPPRPSDNRRRPASARATSAQPPLGGRSPRFTPLVLRYGISDLKPPLKEV